MTTRPLPPPIPPQGNRRRSELRGDFDRSGQSRGNSSSIDSQQKGYLLIAACILVAIILLMILLLAAGAGIGIGLGMFNRSESGSKETESPSGQSGESPAPSPKLPSPPAEEPQPAPSHNPQPPDKSPPRKEEEPDEPAKASGANSSSSTKDKDAEPTDSKPSSNSNGAATSGSDDKPVGQVFSVGGGSFFGMRAEGDTLVYIVDSSSSMSGLPFERAQAELVSSIGKLRRNQSYYVIFFADTSVPMYAPDVCPQLVAATKKNLHKLEQWLLTISAAGGTDPRDALLHALRLKPKDIFLLSDGEFDPAIVDELRAANRDKIRVHTLAFVNPIGEPLLRSIANQNGGKYSFIP